MIASDGGAPHSAPGVITLGTGCHNSVSSGFAAREAVRPFSVRGWADCCPGSGAQTIATAVKARQDDMDLRMVVEHTPSAGRKDVIEHGADKAGERIIRPCIKRK